MNLLLDLQSLDALSYLYISHNLELAGQVADEIAVMHQGRIVECARPENSSRTLTILILRRS